ncbi:MAG: acetolactate synthase small subunit [Defluviitaleaceae bacterium]|nr:acetolactate synthase small subunit [Defluviitaleaceae bacterium]
MKHVLSILVDNQPGVLRRITGLFSRRGYNIDSLSVGETENPLYSRITVAVHGDSLIIDQIRKQVSKVIDVAEVIDLPPDTSIYREIALIKITATTETRADLAGIVNIFRGNVIDVAPRSITVEITGGKSKIDAFIELMRTYGILELARTGLTALPRGVSYGVKAETGQI